MLSTIRLVTLVLCIVPRIYGTEKTKKSQTLHDFFSSLITTTNPLEGKDPWHAIPSEGPPFTLHHINIRDSKRDESERQLDTLGGDNVFDHRHNSGFDEDYNPRSQQDMMDMEAEKRNLETLNAMQLPGYKRALDTLGNMQLLVDKRGLDTLGDIQIHGYKGALPSLVGANIHEGHKRFFSSLGGAQIHGYKREFDSLGGAGLHGYKRYVSKQGANHLHQGYKRNIMKNYMSPLNGNEERNYKRRFDSLGGANIHHGNKRYFQTFNGGLFKENLPQQIRSDFYDDERKGDSEMKIEKRELDSLGGYGLHRFKRSDESETKLQSESNTTTVQ